MTPSDGPGAQRVRVGILLFDGVEVLDFAGPYEVFAGLLDGDRPRCEVVTLAKSPEVVCRGGLRVRADALLAAAPRLDLLVVPGGPGTRAEDAEAAPLLAFIRAALETAPLVTSVCTGAFLLARAGALDGRRATTHHAWRDRLQRAFPHTTVEPHRVIDEGRVLTASGVAAGIDLALYLVARLFGPEVANDRARDIEVSWTYPGDVLVAAQAG